MNPIDATLPISVTLQAHEWNAVLTALSEGPFRVVAPLIQKINAQAQQAADVAGVQAAPALPEQPS